MFRLPLRGTRPLIVAVTAVVITALWVLAIIRMGVDMRSTVAAIERENDNLALTLGEQNSRALRDVEERLRYLARVMAESGSLDAKALEGIDRRVVNMVVSIDAQGLITSTDGKTPPVISVADREYFAFHRDNPTQAPYVGRPAVGRVTGAPIIPVSVRVNRDGRFAGVIVAAMKPSYFNALYGKPQLGTAGVVLLVGTDGFVRAAGQSHSAREDLRDSVLIREQKVQAAGRFVSNGAYGGILRFVSYYTWPEYPSLITVVGRGRDEMLADYYSRRQVVIGVTALSTVIALLLATLICVASRRQAEHLRALRDSEARYRTAAGELAVIVDGSVDMICSFDKDGRFVHVSAGSELVLGHPAEWLVGRQAFELVHPEDLERSREMFRAVREGHPVRAFENRSQCRDGTYANIMWSARWNESEQTMFCVARDVTETKLLVAANAVLADRLRETLEMLAAGFCMLDASWRFTYVNRAAEAIAHRPREEMMGHTIWDVVPGISGTAFETEYRRAMRERTAGRVCAHFPMYGGWFEVRTYPAMEGGLAVYIDDVTEREEALQRLAQSEERFHLVALATSDAIWDWTCSSDEVWWSEGIQALFGHDSKGSARTIEGWAALIHPEDRDRVMKSVADAMEQSVSKWSYEYRFQRADGTYATVRDYASIMRGRDGRPTRVVGALSDVTDRIELERQLMRTQRLESVGTLAGGIAHDLNNVFTPIVMGLNLVGAHGMDAEQRAILETVRASAQRGAQLVKQVLSFARGHGGQRVPLQPGEVVHELERMIRETFPRNIEIVVRVADGLPQVTGDATQVHQVLLNLCLNARDAMPDGGTLKIHADAVTLAEPVRSVTGDIAAGRYVRLQVRDNGFGMDGGVIERLFEPFFTTKPVGSGTGLGLPTALAIVGKHGGGMQVESRVCEGSCFTVWLPASDHVVAKVAAEPGIGGLRGQGETVLVVDDEGSVRDMACRALRAAGYEVVAAESGAQALRLLRSREPDILFTDLMMPAMDGMTLAREAQRLAPSLTVVCTSGIAADAAALPAGAVFLPKPYSVDGLVAAMLEALARSKPVRRRASPKDVLAGPR